MKKIWIALNLVVGPLVLVSYVASAMIWDAETVGGLWGAVPEAVRPLYTANMFFAAGGYFAFGYYLLRCVRPQEVVVFGRFGFGIFVLAYALVLVGSVLWMPLTCMAITTASSALVTLVFAVLWSVAAGSLLLIVALVSARPRPARRARLVAIIGSLLFGLQTILLDAIIWPLNFSV